MKTTKVSPWAAIIWRPDLHKYSAFNLEAPTEKDAKLIPDVGATNTLVPRVPKALLSVIELFYLPWQVRTGWPLIVSSIIWSWTVDLGNVGDPVDPAAAAGTATEPHHTTPHHIQPTTTTATTPQPHNCNLTMNYQSIKSNQS